ncbi:transporter substrate-binding domain-containing protein [Tissierella sp. Yu-01]|uniref:transporter substrate-binding domain-containing protein n=1 Tax=Tissierella sp. Yu-01 TaxID=3035694 RepID=UPI00240E8509|nr:transporter substrate-binding domain-containing protein [Tissierella sp. Yu-01]WFA08841.1 transporter substrate-binding domain-containing protein [Tissierella sp. Yu-01]
MNKIKLVSLTLIVAIFLGACANTEGTTSEVSNKLEQIKEAGVIRVGLEGTFPPFSLHDESGKLVGFEVEIAEVIAKDLGVEVDFIETKWDSLIAGLDVDKYDFVINNVGATDERKQVYDFTDPYMVSTGKLAVSKDNTEINSIEDYKGKKSAQSLTSNYATDAINFGAEIVPVDGFAQAIELVNEERADGTINDIITFKTYLKEHPDANIRLLEEEIPNKNDVGIILQKDNPELLEAINEIIANRTEDGTFREIFIKYIGEDLSVNK